MAKRKKTREQKIAADSRHKDYSKNIQPIQIVAQTQKVFSQIQQAPSPKSSVFEYSYLYSDLIKTTILTFSIIILELVLKYFFK